MERRCKIFSIPEEHLLAVLTGQAVFDLGCLPKDAKIERCWQDQPYRALHVLVSCPSFEVVPINMVPPVEWDVRILRVPCPPFNASYPEGEGGTQ